MPQHSDGDFRIEIIFRQFINRFADRIRNDQSIQRFIRGKQAAIVSGNPQVLVALIDGFEQPLEVFIHRTGVVRIGMLEGLLDAVFRYQSLVFGKGDEQQAIQQLLRGIDKFEGRPLRVVLDEMGQQQFSEGFVVLIELVGDVLVRLLALVQQGQGVAGEQVIRVQ